MAQAGTTGGLGPNRLERLIDEYAAACRARGLAIRTVREAYRYPLYEVFLPFCAEEGIEEPGQVTSRVLDRLTTRLLDVGGRKGPLSKFTVASYVRSINVFLGCARREGEVGEGVKAQAPKLPRAEAHRGHRRPPAPRPLDLQDANRANYPPAAWNPAALQWRFMEVIDSLLEAELAFLQARPRDQDLSRRTLLAAIASTERASS